MCFGEFNFHKQLLYINVFSNPELFTFNYSIMSNQEVSKQSDFFVLKQKESMCDIATETSNYVHVQFSANKNLSFNAS